MNFLKRAYLHIVRKKGKAISLFVFLLMIATMLLTCLSINTAVEYTAANIRKALMGSFTINAKHIDDGLDEDIINQILSIDGLSGNYNLRSYTQASFYNAKGNTLTIKTDGASEIPDGYEHAGKIVANSNSEKDTYFTDAGFKLTEGNHITSNHKNSALIHEDFAKRNNLSVGDCIQLVNPVNEKLKVNVTVVGVFTNTAEQDSIGIAPSYDLYENIVFTDIASCSQLIYGSSKASCEYGDFYVDDPEYLDETIESVKKIPNVSWDNCIITKYDNDYQNAKDSLSSIQNIVFTAIIVVVAITFVVLVLIFALRQKSRTHEIGILLSIGTSKGAVLLQQITEVLIIAVFAFFISFGTSSLIAEQVGNKLLSQNTEQTQTVKLINGEYVVTDKDDEQVNLSRIDVSVSLKDYTIVWLIGIIICVFSTSLAILPIIRIKPKNILSQMS